MKFWFDTEFYEDGTRIQLISIGVVSEDGRLYYAETEIAHVLAQKTDWLEANVLPHLTGPQKPRANIARELIDFMGEKPEIWAYYADYDWVALCQLYGTMMALPKGWPMYCRDVKQLADQWGNPKLPEQTSAEHNAVGDAIWAKEAWLWLHERHGDKAALTAAAQVREKAGEPADDNRIAPPAQELAYATYVESVARALHEAHKPYCDYIYAFENPMSSSDMYRELARAVTLVSPSAPRDLGPLPIYSTTEDAPGPTEKGEG